MRRRLSHYMPMIAVAPSVALMAIFVYGFMLWTGYMSLSGSTLMPKYNFVGLTQYHKLWTNPIWLTAVDNTLVFSVLFIGLTIVIGLALAILLDQRIRAEGFLRFIYLYPMALSFIVTGTAWKWILNPGLGIEHLVRSWGWEHFRFDWLVDPRFALFTLVGAGVWQASGFVMALFLAGLRGVDEDAVKAARLDGASSPTIYRRIVIPQLGPTFITVTVVLVQQALRTFELVVALTGGGPAHSTTLPAVFMYSQTFARGQMGVGAASAVTLFMTIVAVVIPYQYAINRKRHHDH